MFRVWGLGLRVSGTLASGSLHKSRPGCSLEVGRLIPGNTMYWNEKRVEQGGLCVGSAFRGLHEKPETRNIENRCMKP